MVGLGFAEPALAGPTIVDCRGFAAAFFQSARSGPDPDESRSRAFFKSYFGADLALTSDDDLRALTASAKQCAAALRSTRDGEDWKAANRLDWYADALPDMKRRALEAAAAQRSAKGKLAMLGENARIVASLPSCNAGTVADALKQAIENSPDGFASHIKVYSSSHYADKTHELAEQPKVDLLSGVSDANTIAHPGERWCDADVLTSAGKWIVTYSLERFDKSKNRFALSVERVLPQ